MSAHSDKIKHQLILTGAAVGLYGMISALTGHWAYGAQLTKSDRIALPQTKEIGNYDRPRQSGNRIAFCLPAGGGSGRHKQHLDQVQPLALRQPRGLEIGFSPPERTFFG